MWTMGRRGVLAAGAALLAGCGGGAKGSSAPSPDDMVLGDAHAPLTLIEYASAVCPHCRDFHQQVWAKLKSNYIDTGKVRYVFREYPTDPVQVAVAGFQVARCGGATPEQYMTRLGVIFDQQRAMFATGSVEGIREKLIEIGTSSGLTQEQVAGCIADETGAQRIRRIVDAGQKDFGITGTPTLILNGKKLTDPSVVTYEGLSKALDAELSHSGS